MTFHLEKFDSCDTKFSIELIFERRITREIKNGARSAAGRHRKKVSRESSSSLSVTQYFVSVACNFNAVTVCAVGYMELSPILIKYELRENGLTSLYWEVSQMFSTY